jgi:hypothetical protein
MAVRKISPADKKSDQTGSFSREVIEIGGLYFGSWRGYALVKAGVTAANLDIIIPSEQRGIANTTGLIVDAASFITSVAIKPAADLTLGAATGKLKFAPTLSNATAALYVETAAAASNILTGGNEVSQNNAPSAWTTVGGSDVTYRLFATDGAAGAAAAASTVTATVDTKVFVIVNFVKHIPFPANLEFGIAAPSNT